MRRSLLLVWSAISLLFSCLLTSNSEAQESWEAGVAYVTRFSGTTMQGTRPVIDTAGTVGSLVDIRKPGDTARGQHWLNEPQRLPVSAAQVGQVFGVAMDDANPPNIYLSATSAFGLHRATGNAGWMPGMWGPKGGPGTVWKLNAANKYRPELFANVTLKGRRNTGAALGNIAYDRWNKQLYVSDLETGMIHRLGISGANQLGVYDHGAEGRVRFTDATIGTDQSLAKVAFNAKSRAQINGCQDGAFMNTPKCWNLADFRRRVWGLGVRRSKTTGIVRLYYSVWSSQGFGATAFAGAADDEKRNSVWSVAIATDGSFDTTGIRREFFLPDFFTDAVDIKRAGRSHPVSDIAFSRTGAQSVMLLAERGGLRNLGLGARAPFARPHEARVLRYELGANSTWQPIGRYAVGHYDRKKHGPPHLRAGSSGGVDFGFGYDRFGNIETVRPDTFVWMTGDALCDPDGPCFDPTTDKHADISEVHGLQGLPENAHEKMAPAAALKPYPASGTPYPAKGPSKAYMIDADINVDASGNSIAAELARNDATRTGDVEVFVPIAKTPPAYPPTATPGAPTSPPYIPPSGVKPPGGQAPTEPDLGITKVHSGAPCAPGATCAYIIAVTNAGSAPFAGPLYIADVLPPGATFVSNLPPWNCAASGATLDCYHPPLVLAPGAVIDLGIMVSLPASMKGVKEITNCASISWMMNAPPNNIVFEKALKLAGYKTGPVDGVIDPQTKAAILKYQIDNILPPTGTLDEPLRQSLFGGAAGAGDANPGNDGPACVTVALPAAKPPPGSSKWGKASFDLKIEKKVDPAKGCKSGGDCSFTVTITNVGKTTYNGPILIKDSTKTGIAANPADIKWACYTWKPQMGMPDSLYCRHEPITLKPGESVTLSPKVAVSKETSVENCAFINWPLGKSKDRAKLVWAVKYVLPKYGFKAGDMTNPTMDPQSVKALKQFQKKNGLKQTGKLDKKTLSALFPGSGGRPGLVMDVKQVLTHLGYKAGYVGNSTMEQETVKALKKFQKKNGLKETGKLDKDTLNALFPGSASAPGDDKPGNDGPVCAKVNFKTQGGGSILIGTTSLNLGAEGPAECTAPNCTVYDFTVTNDGERDYGAPMSLSIELPPATRLLWAEGTKSAASCRASGWSCIPSGNTVQCRPSTCALAPDEQAGVAVDVQLLPDPSLAIPPEGITKTICGDLQWFAPETKEPDIEQTGRERHSRACVATRILPMQEMTLEQEPKMTDLGIAKSNPGECRSPGNCVYRITVVNQGPDAYEGPLNVTDAAPRGWSLYGGFPSPPWSCHGSGNAIECGHEHAEIPPGESVSLDLEFLVPRIEGRREVENCARIEGPEIAARRKRRPTKEVQQALNDLGYDAGPIDGKIGRQTRNAIKRYQEAKGLPGSSNVDDRLLLSLFPGSPVAFVDSNPGNNQACLASIVNGPPKEEDVPASREPEPRTEERRPETPTVTPPAPGRAQCPPGQFRRGGRCVCREGQRWDGRRCVPRNVACPPGQIRRGDRCVCPEGQRWDGRRCVPREIRCPPGQSLRGGRCVCADGYRWDGSRCVEREQ